MAPRRCTPTSTWPSGSWRVASRRCTIRCCGPGIHVPRSWWRATRSPPSMRVPACLANGAGPWNSCAVRRRSAPTTTWWRRWCANRQWRSWRAKTAKGASGSRQRSARRSSPGSRTRSAIRCCRAIRSNSAPRSLATAMRGWRAPSTRPIPDAAVHLLDQFSSPRAGDLVLAAREGYDFRGRFEIPEHKSGHGSLIRAHMQTPLWTNRPLPHVPMRTADVFPALLDWLDVPVPDGIDGRAVWQPGRAAREHHPRRQPAGALPAASATSSRARTPPRRSPRSSSHAALAPVIRSWGTAASGPSTRTSCITPSDSWSTRSRSSAGSQSAPSTRRQYFQLIAHLLDAPAELVQQLGGGVIVVDGIGCMQTAGRVGHEGERPCRMQLDRRHARTQAGDDHGGGGVLLHAEHRRLLPAAQGAQHPANPGAPEPPDHAVRLAAATTLQLAEVGPAPRPPAASP